MGRLVQRDTGSVVNVPDEDEAAILALGYYDREQKSEPAKKAAASKK